MKLNMLKMSLIKKIQKQAVRFESG